MSVRLRAAAAAAALLAATAGQASPAAFTVASPDLVEGKWPNANLLAASYGFGCAGGNRSPRLDWTGAPAGTKSFVVNIHDIDAKTGVGWMHWVVINIPAGQTSLPGGIDAQGKSLPKGALQTRTDFGVPGYGGPCPPKAETHRFQVTVTALDIDHLPDAVTQDATPAMVGFYANQHALAKTMLEVRQPG
ncbi:YbhB/YbcL family Raf kinase inhibitor-like protein [Sphingomonas sp.]|uniref:YbhB/YbcL family Raf kinase inhibitor-like protein n=1 Tax=Sphingomonas sp. TaxID=28214 RepID=UPI0031D7E61B